MIGNDLEATGGANGLGAFGDGVQLEWHPLVHGASARGNMDILKHFPGTGEINDLGVAGNQESHWDLALRRWCQRLDRFRFGCVRWS